MKLQIIRKLLDSGDSMDIDLLKLHIFKVLQPHYNGYVSIMEKDFDKLINDNNSLFSINNIFRSINSLSPNITMKRFLNFGYQIIFVVKPMC